MQKDAVSIANAGYFAATCFKPKAVMF